jgi:hypothetical protein
MPSRSAIRLGVIVLAMFLAIPASGQSVEEIVDDLNLRHYYLEPGTEVAINDIEALVADHPGLNFVALAGDVAIGADAFAADLLGQLGDGTVIVLTPGEVGAVSFDYSDRELGVALDAVVAASDQSYLDGFSTFASSLSSGFPWVPVLVGGIPLGLVVFAVWSSGRRRRQSADRRLEQARAEIRSQMDVVATQILKLADDPRLEDQPAAEAHYRTASETFQQAETRLAGAVTEAALEDLSDDLDRARWELEAATAVIEGRPPPPEPEDEKPRPCFFDPTHGAGVEEAELQTQAGTQRVLVCKADAEKLRQGDAPEPRRIPMDRGQYPAPQVPRSSGGLGMDWLDVFSILVGGMGRGAPYDWSPRPQRSGGGGFQLPRTRTTRPAGRSSSKSMGRARRTR